MKPMIELDSKEALREVIRRGDDSVTNTLVITPAGHFALLPWQGGQRPDWHTGVAVKLNTFAAWNDYVGPDAAADHRHINPLYREASDRWTERMGAGAA